MRKGLKQFLTIATAAVMSAGVLSLAACRTDFKTPAGYPEAQAESNGGFVVKVGEYIYFINGAESNTADNKYGTPVRGSLMRIKEEDVEAGKNTAEAVIPSLMVAGDHTAGIYVYGDRVYYASPSTVRDTTGVVQAGYLDFKSARLDGTDIRSHFRLSDNSTVYRIVEAGEEGKKAVYVVYADGSDLYSYNLSTGKETLLVAGTTAHTLGGSETAPQWIYYTMSVTDKADSDGSISYNYNQIYRVRVDWTEENAPYEYQFDEEYVKENLDGVEPYRNLGEIVLDGLGIYHSDESRITQFNHSETEPATPFGYTYTLRSFANGGIYFTRAQLTETGSSAAELYFLAQDKLASEWDSVAGNALLDKVATATLTEQYATTSALYYLQEGKHHYLYVNGDAVYRADVGEDGKLTGEAQEIAHGLTSPTLRLIDDTSDTVYHYVYYTDSGTGGSSIHRAVYNGTDPHDYEDLQYGEQNAKPYRPAAIPGAEQAGDWYNFEIVDGILYYADGTTDIGSTAYNYVCAVNLKQGGKLMNNEQLAGVAEKYDEITDADDGLLAKLSEESSAKLSTAFKYYFYTGSTELFDGNIQEAKDAGKNGTYLYTEEEQKAFKAFAEGKGYTDPDGKELFAENSFKDGKKSYRIRSYFITQIGAMSEEHIEAQNEYWRGALNRYVVTNTEKEGLPAWAWALIGVGIGLVVLGGAAVAVVFILRAKKKKGEKPERELMRVDTTDDRSVDVYADDTADTADDAIVEPAASSEEAEIAEPAEEAAESETANEETVEPAEPEAATEPEAAIEPETVTTEPETVTTEPETAAPEATAEETATAEEAAEPDGEANEEKPE